MAEASIEPRIPKKKTGAKKSPGAKKTTTKPRQKAAPRSFPALSALLFKWNPSDSASSRRLLISEIIYILEQSDHKCIRSCIPAIIVDGRYPIDIMHFDSEQGLDEFLTRMLWMHEEYDSAIGILLGVADNETAAMVEEACDDLLVTEKNCIVMLL